MNTLYGLVRVIRLGALSRNINLMYDVNEKKKMLDFCVIVDKLCC